MGKKPQTSHQLCYTQDLHLIPNFLHTQHIRFAALCHSRTFIPPSAQPLLVLWCEIEVDKCERII